VDGFDIGSAARLICLAASPAWDASLPLPGDVEKGGTGVAARCCVVFRCDAGEEGRSWGTDDGEALRGAKAG